MMNYYIYNKQVSVTRAVMVCGSVEKFKQLRNESKFQAGKEYTFHINGKNLTFERIW